jgi:1-deoxy-D-xylulose-5-phosphate synthase
MKLLSKIHSPKDLRKLSFEDMNRLSAEIRQFLIHNISQTGGHLSSNLGTVELTIAMHYSFNSPKDKFVWDVGHQAYVHKILTSRQEDFKTLRQLGGLSGFLKRIESEHDIFEAGHSSTSISAALGIAKANQLSKKTDHVVAIIGDGALTGGMAFEAMNHAGHSKEKVIIVLNDNEMSIDENVGGLSSYLGQIRTNDTYYKIKGSTERALKTIPNIGEPMVRTLRRIKNTVKSFLVPGMLFEDLGLTYIGPVDGHNIKELTEAFELGKNAEKSCVIHVITKKGKGFIPAEQDPDKFHGVNPFKTSNGESISSKKEGYSNVFAKTLCEIAKTDDKIIAMTAAMCSGTGLCCFKKAYPDRFIDVGIAEQHAVTMASGLALEGYKPVFTVYSTFLQRAYDQILHDACIQNLPIIIAIDRAGLVGQDGETHHGVFDIAFLSHIPNMEIYASKDAAELSAMLKSICASPVAPTALRYPRGNAKVLLPFEGDPSKPRLELRYGDDFVLIPVGSMFENALAALELLRAQGLNGKIINPRKIHPMDLEEIHRLAGETENWFSIEDHVAHGGFGEMLQIKLLDECKAVTLKRISLPNAFIEHGKVEELYSIYGLDSESIATSVKHTLNSKGIL